LAWWPQSLRRLIRRHNVCERLNATLRQFNAILRGMMHLPIPEQGCYLRLVLNGFYNYYALTTNFRAINSFYHRVLWHWLRCVRRRSRRHRLTWRKMVRIAGVVSRIFCKMGHGGGGGPLWATRSVVHRAIV